MSREQSYNALILKKQVYGEADEIISVFTREQGKVRLLAPGVRKITSKLQYALQGFTEAVITVAGSGTLPRVIRSEVRNQFPRARQHGVDLFWAAELTLKATPDGQANTQLFDVVRDFYLLLDKKDISEQEVLQGELYFALQFLKALGLEVHIPEMTTGQTLFFSNSAGGFTTTARPQDGVVVTAEEIAYFMELSQQGINAHVSESTILRLKTLINGFLTYQLERTINSQSFL